MRCGIFSERPNITWNHNRTAQRLHSVPTLYSKHGCNEMKSIYNRTCLLLLTEKWWISFKVSAAFVSFCFVLFGETFCCFLNPGEKLQSMLKVHFSKNKKNVFGDICNEKIGWNEGILGRENVFSRKLIFRYWFSLIIMEPKAGYGWNTVILLEIRISSIPIFFLLYSEKMNCIFVGKSSFNRMLSETVCSTEWCF